MVERVDLFDSTYSHFTEQVLESVRKETFGVDIGQNSWLTVEEYDRFLPWLKLANAGFQFRSAGATAQISEEEGGGNGKACERADDRRVGSGSPRKIPNGPPLFNWPAAGEEEDD